EGFVPGEEDGHAAAGAGAEGGILVFLHGVAFQVSGFDQKAEERAEGSSLPFFSAAGIFPEMFPLDPLLPDGAGFRILRADFHPDGPLIPVFDVSEKPLDGARSDRFETDVAGSEKIEEESEVIGVIGDGLTGAVGADHLQKKILNRFRKTCDEDRKSV